MIFLSITIALLGICHFYFTERHKRKLFATATLVSQTEEAESIHFSTQLFMDETPGQYDERINLLIEIAEKRRNFNNDRLNHRRSELMTKFETSQTPDIEPKGVSSKLEALS